MSTFTVKVKFTASATPQFVFIPDPLDVSPAGVHQVKWVRDTSGDAFTFEAVAFHKTNPFLDVVVNTAGTKNEIEGVDFHHGMAEHPYNVLVRDAKGNFFNSLGNTRKRKRKGKHKRNIPGAGNDPTIRNK